MSSSSSTLAPGLARKVKKVLDTRLDGHETVACLKALSEFYVNDENDKKNGGLRAAIERRGLDINAEFMLASESTLDALKLVDDKLEALMHCVDGMEEVLEKKSQSTVALLRETELATSELERTRSRSAMIETFLRDYQLQETELNALIQELNENEMSTSSSSRSAVIMPLFYKRFYLQFCLYLSAN